MGQAKSDQRLREERLVFYREDIARIDEILGDFLDASAAKCALLVDKEGHMVTKRGNTSSFDLDTICALVAGSFAATKEMARLLGETEFTVMFHQGKRDNIQLALVGDRTLLTVIFDDKTTLGMVRLYANETAKELTEVFERRLGAPPRDSENLDQGFSTGAQDALDDIFG